MSPFRAVKIFALIAVAVAISVVSAEGGSVDVVQQLCRSALLSERGAVLVDWSTRALPSQYQKVASLALRDQMVVGWAVHLNPNQTKTVAIHALYKETSENDFIILFDGGGLTVKQVVFTFEFALSRKEHGGVNSIFYCGKNGPTDELVWDGGDWK